MSTWGNDSRLKLTEEAVTAFEQANPGITVQVENSESGHWDKLATQTAANDAPDVIQMDESYIAAYGGRSALLDLSTSHRCWTCPRWTPRCSTPAKSAAPWSVRLSASRSVGVNPELLRQAGGRCRTTRPGPGTTTMASTVTEKLGSKGVVGMDFFGLSAAEIGVWARQRNQEVFPTEGQTAVTEETLVSYFEFAKRMLDTKATPSAGSQVEATTAALDLSPFATNKAAFHLQFHTQIAAFVAASGSDLQVAEAARAGIGRIGADGQQGVDVLVASGPRRARGGRGQAGRFLDDRPCGGQDPQGRAGCSSHPGGPVRNRAGARCDRQDVVDVRSGPAGRGGPPPQVTPQNASGYSAEVTRIGTDVLFERKTRPTPRGSCWR